MSRFTELEKLNIEEQIEIIDNLANENISPKYNHLRDSNFKIIEKLKPLFDYQYLKIRSIPDYCFCNSSLPIDTYWAYFEEVKKYSNMTIGELMKIKHFKISYSSSGEELKIYKKLVLENEKAHLSSSQIPTMGHFPLWTTGQSSPRVFFLVGRMAILNILLLDYDHKIHPMHV